MPSRQLPHKRSLEVRNRIARTEGYPRCVVQDCERPTSARAGAGLNRNYCKIHVEHYKRHGSYSKASYRAPELRPHLAKAMAWLAAHEASRDVQEALDRVRTLLHRGTPEEAFRLRRNEPRGSCSRRLGEVAKAQGSGYARAGSMACCRALSHSRCPARAQATLSLGTGRQGTTQTLWRLSQAVGTAPSRRTD